MVEDREKQPTSELFLELSREVRLWFKQETQLARAEIALHASKIKWGGGLFTLAGMVGYAGLLAIVASAIIALALIIPLWLSALLIGIGCFGAGGVFAFVGYKSFKSAELIPRETINMVQEDIQWLKRRMT